MDIPRSLGITESLDRVIRLEVQIEQLTAQISGRSFTARPAADQHTYARKISDSIHKRMQEIQAHEKTLRAHPIEYRRAIEMKLENLYSNFNNLETDPEMEKSLKTIEKLTKILKTFNADNPIRFSQDVEEWALKDGDPYFIRDKALRHPVRVRTSSGPNEIQPLKLLIAIANNRIEQRREIVENLTKQLETAPIDQRDEILAKINTVNSEMTSLTRQIDYYQSRYLPKGAEEAPISLDREDVPAPLLKALYFSDKTKDYMKLNTPVSVEIDCDLHRKLKDETHSFSKNDYRAQAGVISVSDQPIVILQVRSKDCIYMYMDPDSGRVQLREESLESVKIYPQDEGQDLVKIVPYRGMTKSRFAVNFMYDNGLPRSMNVQPDYKIYLQYQYQGVQGREDLSTDTKSHSQKLDMRRRHLEEAVKRANAQWDVQIPHPRKDSYEESKGEKPSVTISAPDENGVSRSSEV